MPTQMHTVTTNKSKKISSVILTKNENKKAGLVPAFYFLLLFHSIYFFQLFLKWRPQCHDNGQKLPCVFSQDFL